MHPDQIDGVFLFMKKRKIIGVSLVIIGLALIIAGYMSSRSSLSEDTASSIDSIAVKEVTLYKSPTCGCCSNYVAYLKKNGFSVNVVNTDNLDQVKEDNKVPGHLLSCHTTVIGPYVVEGHVPLEAIAVLMEKNPDIKGIGLAGMPSGSPGMPGPKFGPFEVESFMADGSMSEFIKL